MVFEARFSKAGMGALEGRGGLASSSIASLHMGTALRSRARYSLRGSGSGRAAGLLARDASASGLPAPPFPLGT